MAVALSPNDPSSFSRPDLCKVTNIYINLQINFNKRSLVGNVDLTVEKVDPDVKEVLLDIRDLNISDIFESNSNLKLEYSISKPIDEYGSKLSITLPHTDNKTFVLSIRYETNPKASGLQWLTPEQTSGKKLDFMFSQFQPIHARSVIPCQDTPSIKSPYSAVISCPAEYTVVMSALQDNSKDVQGVRYFHFVQKIPIQTYLIAIAAGELVSADVGPRSKVWAEKNVIDAAAYEFGDTEKQLKAAEDICGPYVWGRYDMIVLPASFAYGGMENPCLTFVTPTLLAGDRSLANVVAHEIAHSWSGNLVTNKTFEHFWLNEGFTVFVERKIIGKLEGIESQDLQAILGTTKLREEIDGIGSDNPLTKLVVNLTGVHPDDAFSLVPYEKGHTFLRYLEDLIGGAGKFEPFLREYFDTFKYQSLTTADFQNYFLKYFDGMENLKDIDWELWLHTPGMPPVIPKYNNQLNAMCEKISSALINWDGKSELSDDSIKDLNTTQRIQLFQNLFHTDAIPITKLQQIETKFHLSTNGNSEIKFVWLRICIKAQWEQKLEEVLQWLTEVGRMKFVRPLYRDLYAWPTARPKAIALFKANRQYMMHVTAYTVEKDLKLR